MVSLRIKRLIQKAFGEMGLARTQFDYLAAVVARYSDPYTSLKIMKGGTGRVRSISIPNPMLARIQRKILTDLESACHSQWPAHAYIKTRSHATAAEVHLGMTWGIKVDISRFFDHITEDMVLRALRKDGFGELSEVYSKLCTRVELGWPNKLPKKYSRLSRTLVDTNQLGEKQRLYKWAKSEFSNFGKKRFWVKVEGSSSQSSEGGLVIPPKRLPRLHPAMNTLSPNHESGGASEKWPKYMQIVRYLFKVGDSRFVSKVSSALSQHINPVDELSNRRWSMRKAMIRFHSNPDRHAIVSGDSRQRFYKVRPEQYRQHRVMGYLPQGAPTSGFISNMVMQDFDRLILNFCRKNGLRYTRYSDDIVVSSTEGNYSRDNALSIISFVQKTCELNGFTLNKAKTRILTPGSRKFILGLLVNGEALRLGKHERQSIERCLYQIAKFGASSVPLPEGRHALNGSHFLPHKRIGSHANPNESSDRMASLFGWLSYCKRVDAGFLRKINDQLTNGKFDFMEQETKANIHGLVRRLLEIDAA